MAERNDEAAQEQINTVNDATPEASVEAEDSPPEEDSKDLNKNEENQISSMKQDQEEVVIKKKYGGLLPKKPPLISKDHEHAFFDSADWALGKAGAQKSKGPLEALRPKLQPTPHQQLRSRSAYAPPDDGEDGCEFNIVNPENQDTMSDDGVESNEHCPDNQNHQKDRV
ncbi:hypothetical protein BUALT_Bualt05G0147200 [Buddleja alternifolia]|uniref:Endosulphine n=1 Tax=Buddleja alternifolia TaxID=168488 RepID=A0AAV6XVD3_9LAMI|nr:hypothetical protein BUALT_Bualt05G0147200 [Buddleja alternifolia]